MTDNPVPEWAIRLQVERKARGWSQRAMARELFSAIGVDPTPQQLASLARQIRGYESGKRPRDWREAYATALGLPEDDLFGEIARPDHDEVRRRLLACLGLLGVDTAARTEHLESIRQALTAALPGGMQEHLVRDWEEVAFEHGHAFLTTAPDVLLPDLAADLVALLDSIRTAGRESVRQNLCAPAGRMATIMAMTVATLGHRRHARDWWRTARHTADASQDRDLRTWVRGYEAMSSLYAGRPFAVVLRLADEAIGIAGDDAGAASLEAMAAGAQVLSLMPGRKEEAAAGMRALEQRWDGLPAVAPDDRLAMGAWPETALQHTAAFTYTHTGDADLADRARTAALSLYPPAMRRQRAQIELLTAVGLVQDGEVAAGLAHAAQTIQVLAPSHRTTTIQRGARMVLDAVPDEGMTAPVVLEYRDALTLRPGE